MNQILVTKKLYITPELKRKKKLYKFEFLFSVFLVCILISFCIYAEYDRNKSEEVSQVILANMENEHIEIPEYDDTVKSNILVAILNEEEDNQALLVEEAKNEEQEVIHTTQSGYKYKTIAQINIPKINVNYPILEGIEKTEAEIEALLKISPCKFWGVSPNEVGNLSIVGHNYRNNRFFSKVQTLVVGDIIEITAKEKTVQYEVYDKYTVVPNDTSCTDPYTGGKKEITLITCTDDSKQRVIVKAREIK